VHLISTGWPNFRPALASSSPLSTTEPVPEISRPFAVKHQQWETTASIYLHFLIPVNCDALSILEERKPFFHF
jgi:hypothetical protein